MILKAGTIVCNDDVDSEQYYFIFVSVMIENRGSNILVELSKMFGRKLGKLDEIVQKAAIAAMLSVLIQEILNYAIEMKIDKKEERHMKAQKM